MISPSYTWEDVSNGAMSMLLLTLYHLLAQVLMQLQCSGCVEAVRGRPSTS